MASILSDINIRSKKSEPSNPVLVLHLKSKLLQFFAEELPQWMNCFDRNQPLSILLLILGQQQVFQFCMNKELFNIMFEGTHFEYATYGSNQNNAHLKVFCVDCWSLTITELIFYASLLMNVTLISLLAIKLTCFMMSRKMNPNMLISLLFRTYSYSMFVYSIHSSLTVLPNHKYAVLNIILSIFLEILITVMDFDHRYVVKDFLGKRNETFEVYFIFMKVICTYLMVYGKPTVIPFTSFGYLLLRVINSFWNHPYLDRNIQEIEFSLNFIIEFISFALICSIMSGINIDFTQIFMYSVPLGFLAGKAMFSFLYKSIFKNVQIMLADKGKSVRNDRSQQQIDLYLRYLFTNINCVLEMNLHLPYSLIFEGIIADHHQNCTKAPFCFCQDDIERRMKSRQDFIGDSTRKQYLLQFILDIYENEIINKKNMNNSIYVNYLSFLIGSVKNQTQCFREIFQTKLEQYESSSIFQKQKIYYFLHLTSIEFELDVQKLTAQKEGEILDVIDFDDSLLKCSEIYRMCLQQRIKFLSTLSKHFIDIVNLEKGVQDLQKNRRFLNEELKRLFIVNSTNLFLNNICEGFSECLTIDDTFAKIQSAKIKFGKNLNMIKYSENDSAAVFISLMNDIGRIKKVSRNFCEVVPLFKSNKDALQKNISFMQVDEIGAVHDQILLNYLKRRTNFNEVQQIQHLYGKDARGWALLYKSTLNLCILNDSEIGVCGLIKQIDLGRMFIIASDSQDNYRIYNQSEKIYKKLFANRVSQSESKRIRLANILPMLPAYYAATDSKAADVYDTVIVCPASLKLSKKIPSITDPLLVNQLAVLNLLSIKFVVQKVTNPMCSYVSIEVYSLSNLSDAQCKAHALDQLRLNQKEYLKNVDTPALPLPHLLSSNPSSPTGLKIVHDKLVFELTSNTLQTEEESELQKKQSRMVKQTSQLSTTQKNGRTKKQSKISAFNFSPKMQAEASIMLKEESKFQITLNHNDILKQTAETPILRSHLVMSQDSFLQSPSNLTLNSPLFSPKMQDQSEIKLTQDQMNFTLKSPQFLSPRLEENLYTKGEETKYNYNEFDHNEYIDIDQNSNVDEISSKEETQNEEEDQDDILFQMQNQTGSVKTGINSRYAQKKRIGNVIRTKKGQNGLQIINAFGIISIFIICGLNLMSFFIQKRNLEIESANFKMIEFPLKVRKFMDFVFGGHGIYKGMAAGIYDFASEGEKNMFNFILSMTSGMFYEMVKQCTRDVVAGDPDSIYVIKLFTEEQVQLQYVNTMDLTTYTTHDVPLVFDLMYLSNLFYYITQRNDPQLYNEIQAIKNYDMIYSSIDAIAAENLNYFLSDIENRKTLIATLLILISIVTGLFSFMVAPVYAYSQTKRQEILILFSTISFERILLMYNTTLRYLKYHEFSEQSTAIPAKKYSSKSFEVKMNQVEDNSKTKKNISSTNTLPKVKAGLVFGILVSLISAQFYPIIQYIEGIKSTDQFTLSLHLTTSMDYLLDNISTLIDIKHQSAYYMLGGLDNTTRWNKQVDYYIDFSQKKLNQTDPLLKTLKKYLNQYQNGDYSSDSDYISYMIPLFEGNLCATFQSTKYPTLIGYDDCVAEYGGIFQQGILIAVTKYLGYLTQFFEGFWQKDAAVLEKVLNSQQEVLSIVEEFNYQKILISSGRAIHQFIELLYDQQYNSYYEQSLILLVIQLFMLLVILIFGWNKFYSTVGNSLFATKQLLDLIDPITLLENPYIQQYFKKSN